MKSGPRARAIGIVALAGAILAGPGLARASCQMFEHSGFQGLSLTVEDNKSMAELGALNDRVSSIKVSPQCLLVAYADARYQGAMTTFSPGEHPALMEGWDDQISSARCNCR